MVRFQLPRGPAEPGHLQQHPRAGPGPARRRGTRHACRGHRRGHRDLEGGPRRRAGRVPPDLQGVCARIDELRERRRRDRDGGRPERRRRHVGPCRRDQHVPRQPLRPQHGPDGGRIERRGGPRHRRRRFRGQLGEPSLLRRIPRRRLRSDQRRGRQRSRRDGATRGRRREQRRGRGQGVARGRPHRPLAVTGTVSGPAVQLGAVGSPDARACSALPAGSLTGKIPLIERGVCTFRTKVLNAQNAGASAVVVYNQIPAADPIVMGGSGAGITIPGVMIGNLDGIAVSGAIGAGTTFTMDPANILSIPNRLQGFTSRGPRFGDSALKPDLTAPGGNIFSALAGSGDDGINLSGTSMASPHVAGAAALLRQLHPTWSVQEIKDVLMNTATDAERGGEVYPVALMGAGHVRVDVAADVSSVVVPGSATFGVRESDRTAVMTYTFDLQVRNKGTSMKTFTLSLQIDFRLLPPSDFLEYDGFVTLTQTNGGDVLRVPFHVIPVARSAAGTTGNEDSHFTLRNRGLADSLVDIYQLGEAVRQAA